MSEGRAAGSGTGAVDTARAAPAGRAVAVRVAARAWPDDAAPAGEQVHGVLLALRQLEATGRVAVVVLHRRVERGVDLLLAVVDDVHGVPVG